MRDPVQATAPARIPARVEHSKPNGSPAERPSIQLDSAASAALALAVTTARGTNVPAQSETASPELPTPARPSIPTRSHPLRPVLSYSATAALALALGWGGAHALAKHDVTKAERPWAETTQALRQSQDEVARLAGDIASLKAAVAALGHGVDLSRSEADLKQARILDKLDHSLEAPRQVALTLAGLGEQMAKLETGSQGPALKLDALGERLDRIEHRLAAGGDLAGMKPTPIAAEPSSSAALASDAPTKTGSLDTPPSARESEVEGWVLREVYDGIALIESRGRRLVEVGLGEMVPGVGRVEAIERRGKRWVVVTAKGVIGMVR
jgi:hypothetical protein